MQYLLSARWLSSAFFMIGTGDGDRLELVRDKLTADLEVSVPTRALPWHETLALLERWQSPRPAYGHARESDPAEHLQRELHGHDIAMILGINGAERAHVEGLTVRIVAAGEAPLVLSEMRLQRGAKMPVRLRAGRPQPHGEVGWIHKIRTTKWRQACRRRHA